MPIQSVCFDLDGTLIDSTEAIVNSFNHTFDVLEKSRPPREAVVNTIGYTLEDQFRMMTNVDPGRCTRVYREHYGRTCTDNTFLIDGAAECLHALNAAGLPLGFATSKRRLYAEQVLEHLNVLDYFTVRIGPDDVSKPKPDPECLFKAAEAFGCAPDSMAYVGDTKFDMGAAKAAGAWCVAVTFGYASREELLTFEPDAVHDDLPSLTRHLLERAKRASASG
jgi:phosphoglycolate phosphatase